MLSSSQSTIQAGTDQAPVVHPPMAPEMVKRVGRCHSCQSTFVQLVNPPVSNTGGASFAGKVVAFGGDTAKWYLKIDHEQLRAFRERLKAGQVPVDTQLGMRGVNGYEFVLVPSAGLRVYVAPEGNLSMGLYVIAGPRWLRSRDITRWESELLQLVESWGLQVLGLKLNWFDTALDVRMGEFVEVGARDVVSKARYRSPHFDGTEYTGISIGKSELRLRYYNKTAEAGDMLPFWQQVWTEDCSRQVVGRFEWQIRGKALQQFGVRSIADLLACWGDILRYLLDWARFADRAGGHEHERADMPIWAWLRSAVGRLELGVQGVVRYDVPRIPNVEQLLSQMAGLVASVAAAVGIQTGAKMPAQPGAVLGALEERIMSPAWKERQDQRWRDMRLVAAF